MRPGRSRQTTGRPAACWVSAGRASLLPTARCRAAAAAAADARAYAIPLGVLTMHMVHTAQIAACNANASHKQTQHTT